MEFCKRLNNHTVTGNHFSWFSHSGSAEYEITYHKENINEYRISPMRLNIPSTQVGNTIRFTVDKPTKLILQVNYPLVDNMKHSRTHNKNMLFLYADEPEVNPPKPGDPNVIVSGSNINSTINSAPKNAIVYVPKGTYNQQVKISKSDITLYLAPGANIVNTYVNPKKNDHLDQEEVIYFLYNTNNVTIKGRGFLQGNGDLLRPRNSSDFILEDLVLLNNGSHRMGIVFWGEDLDNLTVRNIKVLTDAADGIDPVGCRNCLIEKNIVYSADDAIVIKERYRTTYNVTVKNNIAWSYNANALKIGGHFFKLAPVNGINFIDNDAIYEGNEIPNGFNIGSNTRNGFGDITSTITNTYNENLKGILDSYSYYYNDGNGYRWSGKVRLSINNMRIRKARAGNHGIRIESESDPSKVDAIVTFNNLWIQDRYITSKQDLIDLGYNPFYPNVTINFNVSSNPVNPDNESPSKPEKLTASERTPTSVKLNWIASTDNIGVEKYEVHYNDKIKTVIGTSTTLTDLTPNLNPPITVRALDNAGNHSNFSDPAIETDTSDTVAPNIPTGLKLDSVRDTAAYISWSTSTDDIGIASGYRIFRDNVEIGTSITTSYSDYTVQVQRNYNYTVTVFDVSGNESQQSSPFSVSIPASGVVDTIAPSIPTDLTLNDATSNEVSISWTASLDDIRFVAIYHIMRNGSEIGTSTTTSYTDNTISIGNTYNYSITAEDNSGNESSPSNELVVEVGSPILTAIISANPSSGNEPLTVDFDASASTDPDGTIDSYSWDFDDGSSYTGISTNHVFNTVGIYNITLTVTNNEGITDTTAIQIVVIEVGSSPPSAVISANPLAGQAPLSVSFNASASSDPDGNITSYNWNFGDGNSGTGENTTHTFNTAGTYDVTLTVTDNSGNTDTESTTITVDPEPNSCIFAIGNGVSNGSFEDSLNDWIYHNNGSGTASVSNVDPQHCDYVAKLDFNATGSNVQFYQQTVNLDATTDYTFSFTAKASTPRTIKVFLHKHTSPYNDYGLGTITANLTTEWQTFTYNFKSKGFTGSVFNSRLRFWLVTAQPGDTMFFDNIVIQKEGVEPPQPVVPSILTHPQDTSAFIDQTATFSVSAQGTAPLQYQWKRDGLDIAGATSASYTTDTLVAADDGVLFSVVITNSVSTVTSNTAQLTVSVTPNQKPSASFSVNNSSGIAPLTVNFDASASVDSDGSIDSYSWDFDDGGTDTGITPSYIFNTPGVYTVSLTVTDNEGESDTTTTNISVSAIGSQLPTAVFSATPLSGTVPLTVDFDAIASTDPDGNITAYSWDFGDGNSETGVTSSHTFDAQGTYNVTLTVTDNNDNTATVTTTITVDSEPGSCVHAVDNGVLNGSFEEGLSNWIYHNSGGGSASVSSVAPQHCDFSAKLDFTASGNNVQLYQRTVGLDADTDYTFSFTAKASTPRTIKVFLHKHTSPYNDYGLGTITANLTTEWQTFTYNFKSKGFIGSVFNGRLRFWLVTAQPGDTMFFDNIVIQKEGVEPPQPVVPSILTHPQDTSAFIDQSATFSVSAQGTAPLQYQWQRDGQDIAGANSSSYSTNTLVTADDGALFSVVITNSVSTVTSNTAQLTVSLAPNQTPSASFSVDNSSGIAPLTVNFDASASVDSDGSIDSYSWDFGDGGTDTGITPNYIFNTPGVYTVSLTVTDNEGESDTETIDISVTTVGSQPDITPPVINNILATVTDSTATITWDTDELSNSVVDYGFLETYGTNVNNSAQVTAHSLSFLGLNSNTLYHYQVKSSDNSGNLASSVDQTFTTATTGDTTPPVVSAISTAVTDTTATITWTTDEPSTSVISYGETTTYGSTDTSDAILVTDHSVTLSGLTAATDYHFEIVSSDASTNISTTLDQTFTTAATADATPPVVSAISTAVTDATATITWTTDEPSTSVINYGETTAYGNTDTSDATLVTDHSVTLSGLTAATDYHFEIVSTDVSSNSGASADQLFTTGITINNGWWNNNWNYRASITVNSGNYARSEKPVEVVINFTSYLDAIDQTTASDENSIRVHEVDVNDNIIAQNIPFQFDSATDFDATTNAQGTLVFILSGNTASQTDRYFQVYFDVQGGGYTASTFNSRVNVTDNVTDEGQSSFQINSDNANYFYQKQGAGFSSIVDNNGNDWISYHQEVSGESGAANQFRGLPNLVSPANGGDFHPGATSALSVLMHEGPLKATIESITTDGLWKVQWEFFPNFARMTVNLAAENYWFLYEGTPGGTLDLADFMMRSDETQNLVDASWTSDISDPEWVYFSDPNVGNGRSLFLAHHTDDSAIDSYSPLDSATDLQMTVFGFGRDGMNSFIDKNQTHQFTIGLTDSTDFAGTSATIESAYRTINATITSSDQNPGVGGSNTAPTVEAGDDQTIALSVDATLDGTVSDDGLPTTPGTVTTLWTLISGPTGGTVLFADATQVDTTANFSVEGTYVLDLDADDSELASNDQITITVNAGGIDTTAPTIVGTISTTVTETTAILTWVTDEPTTSTVNYGENTTYSDTDNTDNVLVTNHSITLSNLTPETEYHFEVISSDGADNSATSADQSFTTSTQSIQNYTIYEDGEDGTTDGWIIYDQNPAGATITNVDDTDTASRIILFQGEGLQNGYRLGGNGGTPEAWNNASKVINWDMKFEESFVIYITVETTLGQRYLTYNQSSTSKIDGIYIINGLDNNQGTINSQWTSVSRNLESDLQVFEPTNEIISVNGFLVRGDGRIDNIKLPETTVNTAPTVDAGVAQTIALSVDATLDGTVSDDGLPTTPGTVTNFMDTNQWPNRWHSPLCRCNTS